MRENGGHNFDKNRGNKLKQVTLLLWVFMLAPIEGWAQLEQISLKSSAIEVLVTPDAGGRVLSSSLIGHQNFLKLGAAVTRSASFGVNENSPFIPYFGHETWFGPQSEWWLHQLINPQRRALKAVWPPDPFSVLLRNQITHLSDKKIVMRSQVSPVTGLLVEKTFELVADNPNQFDLLVKAKNSRDTDVAWDIWFNTRSFSQTRIFAPVDTNTQIRTMDWPSAESAPVNYKIEENLLSLQLENPPKGKSKLIGKVLFQPSEGWFAAFNKNQLLIVQFPYLPIEDIHPEQGQLEFYLEYNPANDYMSVLEMEVHSAYKKLKPGEEMQARERWTLIEYSGDESVDAQRKFLREQLQGLRGI